MLGQDNIWQRQLFSNLESEGAKNEYIIYWYIHYIDKIAFEVVQIKFLAMYITNKKWSFDIFTLQNIFIFT